MIKVCSFLFVWLCNILLTAEAGKLLLLSIIDRSNVPFMVGTVVALCWLLPTSASRIDALADKAKYAFGLD